MDWSRGYTPKYYMTILDKQTMRDQKRIELNGGSIKRTLDNLRQSADLNCDGFEIQGEEYVRVWLDVEQQGSVGHTPLFTGLAMAPKSSYKGYKKSNNLECYSVLKIAEDMLLPRGWYAPIESNGALIVKDLLSVIGVPIILPEDIEIDPLPYAIVSETNENRLSMSDKILSAMNWALRLNGDGSINIAPISYESKLRIDAIDNDIIENQIDITYDWYSAPNVLRCIMDMSYAEARDENPDSPLSIQNRGREVWIEEDDVVLATSETLSSYATRRLEELQQSSMEISYTRRYWPDVIPGDVITIGYPRCGVNGKFLITDQSIELSGSARTSEEVVRVWV